MKKRFLSIAILVAVVSFSACKEKQQKKEETTTTSENSQPAVINQTQTKSTENAPLTYTVIYTPDSAILGKSQEALVKLIGGEAIALQDADGKSKGLEVTFKLRVTNKSTLENKKYFTISPDDARLELDNGTSITYKTNEGKTNPDPESTTEGSWIFAIPENTKPVKLNLFYDGTRVAVNVALTEKK